MIVTEKTTSLSDALAATWPAAQSFGLGGWTIRDGQGGGKRVCAATANGDWQDETIPEAEAAMARLGQPALFRIGPEDVLLDQALQSRGYRIVDPVLIYDAPLTELTASHPSRNTALPHWPPLQICNDIWAEGEIGPQRLAVMQRAEGPKTAILARNAQRPIGVCFVAEYNKIVMLHAMHVRPDYRRQGAAHNMLREAAIWGLNQGAQRLALVVTLANAPARALYASLGMQVRETYHYRQR